MLSHLLNALPVNLNVLLKAVDIPDLPTDFISQWNSHPLSALELFLTIIGKDPDIVSKISFDYTDTIKELEDGSLQYVRDYIFSGVYGSILSFMLHSILGHGLSIAATSCDLLPIFDPSMLLDILMFIV